MDTIKKYQKPLAFLLGAVILSLVCRRSLPLFIYITALLVAYFPLKNSLSHSITFRILIALVTLLCLFQMEAITFWALNIWVAPLTYLVTSLLLVIAGLWWINKREDELHTTAIKVGYLDLLLVLPGLLLGGVYVTGTLAPSQKDSATIVRSITYGMDDVTHAILFSDVLRHDSNVLAGARRSQLMTKSVNASYPMGWHIATSIVAESAAGNKHRTPIESIEVYFYAKVATLILAATAVTVFIYTLAMRFWPKLNTWIAGVGIAGISLFITSLIILPLFFDGFFSFMPIILYTMLFVQILIDNKNRLADTTLLVLLAAASSLTWMLTGPILTAAFALYYLTLSGSFKKLPLKVYIGTVVSSLFMLAQAYILYSANKNSLANISNEGGILSPNHLLLMVSLVVFFVIFIRKGKNQETVARPLLGFVTIYITVLSLLLLYLSTGTSEITYYYYKLQVPLLIIALSVASVYVFGLLFAANNGKKVVEQSVMMLAGLALLCISIPSLVGYDYVYGVVNRTHSYVISSSDAMLLVNHVLNHPISDKQDRVLFMFPSQPPRNILISNIDKMNYRSTDCDYKLFSAVYTYDTTSLNKALEQCAPVLPPIKIYTNVDGKKQLAQSIDSRLFTNHEVSLVVI